MKRSFLILALCSVLLAVFPALALADAGLSVNGDRMVSPDIFIENGTSMINIDDFAQLAGADVEETSQGFSVQENEITLVLTPGETSATINGEQLQMPCAPQQIEGEFYAPLRFMGDVFGYDVAWIEGTIILERTETRDGMTPMELLVKSNQIAQETNTYSMDGTMNISIKMETDGQQNAEAPQNITTEFSGQIQMEPMEAYTKQVMNLPGVNQEVPADMTVETYMTAEKMYIKAPGQGWVAQDMPFSPEFWKEQQQIQSDPLKAVEQMQELGILVNYGNDVTIDGQDYYVVNATMDMEKFMDGYMEMLNGALSSYAPAGQTSQEDLAGKIEKLFSDSFIDYFYTVYINKETFMSDIIDIDMTMDLALDPAELAGEEVPADVPEEIRMIMSVQGQFKITGVGEPFEAPDVSGAVDQTETGAGSEAEQTQ